MAVMVNDINDTSPIFSLTYNNQQSPGVVPLTHSSLHLEETRKRLVMAFWSWKGPKGDAASPNSNPRELSESE